MDQFKEGDVLYHKATGHRCVVIKIENGTIKVRDQDNKEYDYYPQELRRPSSGVIRHGGVKPFFPKDGF